MSYRTLSLIALAAASILVPPSLSAQGAFGTGLVISGREVVVGQPGNVYSPGVVYFYRQDAKGAWTVGMKLTRSGATNGDGFGSAVAIDGNTLLVGSEKADSGVGAVYIFTRNATGWRETGRLTPQGGQAGDGFGTGIVLAD